MNVRGFLQDIIDRYGFHFIAWIGPVITFVILALLYLSLFILSMFVKDTTVSAIGVGILFFTFPVVFPCYTLLYTLIFLTLRHNEKNNLKFRLKQNVLTHNIFIQILFIFLVVLGIAFYLSMLRFTFEIFFTAAESVRMLAFGFGIPFAILVLVIYSIVLKFFHIDSPINWD